MRCLIHLGVVAGLALSFAQAPFQHRHASDPHHEHAQGFSHTHWETADGPSWEADDHDSDARMLDWLAGDGSAPAKFAVALPESVEQVAFTIQAARIPELTPRNHDPPSLLTFSPRGPPA